MLGVRESGGLPTSSAQYRFQVYQLIGPLHDPLISSACLIIVTQDFTTIRLEAS
jgi:hypothetical protein